MNSHMRSTNARLTLLIVPMVLVTACASSDFSDRFLQALASTNPTYARAMSPRKLMLFGGKSHDTYLGCLSCDEYATDSVFNAFGPHGGQYQANSIFNHYSQFGSQYSRYSACNPNATDPPVIVDDLGKYYGRLTMNEYHPDATTDESLLQWLTDAACADE